MFSQPGQACQAAQRSTAIQTASGQAWRLSRRQAAADGSSAHQSLLREEGRHRQQRLVNLFRHGCTLEAVHGAACHGFTAQWLAGRRSSSQRWQATVRTAGRPRQYRKSQLGFILYVYAADNLWLGFPSKLLVRLADHASRPCWPPSCADKSIRSCSGGMPPSSSHHGKAAGSVARRPVAALPVAMVQHHTKALLVLSTEKKCCR